MLLSEKQYCILNILNLQQQKKNYKKNHDKTNCMHNLPVVEVFTEFIYIIYSAKYLTKTFHKIQEPIQATIEKAHMH